MAPNLEVLDLGSCDKLVEIGTSLKTLNKITKLNVEGCKSLSYLPELPNSVIEMGLCESGLRQMPLTIGGLTQLKKLPLSLCEQMKIFPSSISTLLSLEVMDLYGCSSLSLLPELPTSIVKLYLTRSGLKHLPSTIGHLTHLKRLILSTCEKLESLPSSICNLTSLETLDFSECINLQKVTEDFGNLKSLKNLYASCSGLTELPWSFQNLKKLIELDLTDCKELKDLPALPSNLEKFYSSGCISQFTDVKSSIVEQYLLKLNHHPAQIHRHCVDDAREVPSWMMYRNDCGSSISLELETVGCTISLVFCVVVSSLYAPCFSSHINPMATLTNQNSEAYQSSYYPYWGQTFWRHLRLSTILLLWNCNDIDFQFLKEVSFKLKNDSGTVPIIKCGVHPIFHNKNHKKRTHPENEEDPNASTSSNLRF